MSSTTSLSRKRKGPARLAIATSVLLLIPVLGALSHPERASADPPGAASGWTETFDDEFSGTSLDTSKWTVGWPDYNASVWAYGDRSVASSTANVSEHDGYLWLANSNTSTTVDGVTYSKTSSEVETKGNFEATYGYAEARLRMAGGNTTSAASVSGNHEAFWLMPHYADSSPTAPGVEDSVGMPYDGRPSGSGAEIDAYEYEGSGNTYDDTYWEHGYGNAPNTFQGQQNNSTVTNPYDWHTVGVQWSPGELQYYVDGTLMNTITSPNVPSSPEFLLLQSIMGTSTASDLQVDYVRFYQPTGTAPLTTTVAPPTNYVQNPIFSDNTSSFNGPHVESTTTTGWTATDYGQGTSYFYTESAANAGYEQDTHGTFYSASAYQGYAGQTLTVPNGTYTLTAEVKSGGGQTSSYLEAQGFGGTTETATIPTTAISSWQAITIPNVTVTNGQAQIGIYTNANAGNWILFDRVQFYQPTWHQLGTGATNVAVDSEANTWVTNSSGQVWEHSNSGWAQDTTAPANAVAIAAGAVAGPTTGSTVITTVTSNGTVYTSSNSGSTWTQIGTGALNVGNDNAGNVWVTNSAGQVWEYSGGTWTQDTAAPTGAVAIAAGGDVTIDSHPATVAVVTSSGKIYQRWGTTWTQIGTGASHIAVDSTGQVWVTNSSGQVWEDAAGIWSQNVAATGAAAIGGGNYGTISYVSSAGNVEQN